MFDHLKQLFVHDFGNSFLIVEVICKTLFDFYLKLNPSRQTLSNAWEMSRKTPLT